MKTLSLFVLFGLFVSSNRNPLYISILPKSDTSEKALSLYANTDTINISTVKSDIIKSTRSELKIIAKTCPELTDDIVLPPDECYAQSRNKSIGTAGTNKYRSFNCELCADDYYAFYAYFLYQRDGGKKYQEQRIKLVKIYQDINHIFGVLDHWGNAFGHEHTRILGRVEYAVYLYSKDKELNQFDKQYHIDEQKQLYFKTIDQVINDEMNNDPELTSQERISRKKELVKTAGELGRLISSYFYLKMAQQYQYSNYY